MKKSLQLSALSLSLALLASSCSGLRTTGNTSTAHAESFNLFGLAIPGDDHEAAMNHVPAGATVHTVYSSPRDWTSVVGVLNSIFGFTATQVTYTTK
jgi:hypothetical protein